MLLLAAPQNQNSNHAEGRHPGPFVSLDCRKHTSTALVPPSCHPRATLVPPSCYPRTTLAPPACYLCATLAPHLLSRSYHPSYHPRATLVPPTYRPRTALVPPLSGITLVPRNIGPQGADLRYPRTTQVQPSFHRPRATLGTSTYHPRRTLLPPSYRGQPDYGGSPPVWEPMVEQGYAPRIRRHRGPRQ